MAGIDDISIEEVALVLNRGAGRWKDDMLEYLAATEVWVNGILIQTPQQAKRKKDACEVCGVKDSYYCLEVHHIAGRKHSHHTITACTGKCHPTLSLMQYLRDDRWWKSNQPENVRQAFLLWGLRDVLLLKGEVTANINYIRLADDLIRDIARLLGGR